MIKELNLLSLLHAHQNLEPQEFRMFLDCHGVCLKDGEVVDLIKLISSLKNFEDSSYTNLESFLIGYKIPQIGKEFDLLRFGENFNINIELKSSSDEEKILNQLKRNRYYLRFLGGGFLFYYICISYK